MNNYNYNNNPNGNGNGNSAGNNSGGNNNIDMTQVMSMLSRMNKKDLEAGITIAQQILKSKDGNGR